MTQHQQLNPQLDPQAQLQVQAGVQAQAELQPQTGVHPQAGVHPQNSLSQNGEEQFQVAGQPQIVYVKRPASGASYWLVGLTVLVPMIGWIIGPASMVGSSKRGLESDDAFEREVARNASNWGKTMLCLVGIAVLFYVVAVAAMSDSTDNYPVLIASVAFIFLLGAVNLVGIICGGVSASQGRVFRFALAIPFRKREADFHVA